MYKKVLSFILALLAVGTLTCMLTIVLSTSIPVSAMETSTTECQPYEDMDYNYDIVTKEDWEKTEIGEYPIDVHSEIWNQLSVSETIAACNMPKEFAETLTTEELVEYAVNYPHLISILTFNTISDGMDGLERKSFVFEELFSRADCYDKLIEKYLEIDIDYAEPKSRTIIYQSCSLKHIWD